MSDDQSAASFTPRAMPRTFRAIVDRGTVFTRGIATPPQCCPSRAGFLTGEYPHNDGVVWNDPGYAMLLEPDNTLPSWLQASGYRTAMIGKYLNGYTALAGGSAAPGWSYWYDVEEEPLYYGSTVSVNGRETTLDEDRYLTTVLNRRAVRFADRSVKSGDPFFLWLAQYAPHPQHERVPHCHGYAPVPKPGDYRRFRGTGVPKPPNYDERDIRDKPPLDEPPLTGTLPRLDSKEEAGIRRNWRCGLAALREVDRGMGDLVRTLRRDRALRRTVIVFLSDNGVFYGNHRIPNGKVEPYQEGLRVPFAARVPRLVLGHEAVGRIRRPVAQIDLAPTILELAGARPCTADGECREMDGRSLVGLLRGSTRGWPSDRALLVELTPPGHCGFRALTSRRYAYVERSDPNEGGPCEVVGRELYDLRTDPYELHNLAQRRLDLAGQLSDRLRRLASCKGIRGRDPEPGPGAHCE